MAAANRDLGAEVRAGRFREDLLYRLDVLRLNLPALADRVDDIPELAEHFLESIERRTGTPGCLARETVLELQARAWPGNARQLRNALEHAAALARGSLIEAHHLPAANEPAAIPAAMPTGQTASWRSWQAASERAFLLSRLEANGWNRTSTARELGLSRQGLHERLKRLDLRPRLVVAEGAVRQEATPSLPTLASAR